MRFFSACYCNFHHNEPVKSYCIRLGANREKEGVIWIPVGHQPLVFIFLPLCYCVSFPSSRDALRPVVQLCILLCHFPTGLIKGLKQCSVNRAALQSKHQFFFLLLLCCQALKVRWIIREMQARERRMMDQALPSNHRFFISSKNRFHLLIRRIRRRGLGTLRLLGSVIDITCKLFLLTAVHTEKLFQQINELRLTAQSAAIKRLFP